MSKMGSHGPFGHLKHKLWPKERPVVKLAIWLSTTKSQESTRFTRVQVAWDISLETSRQRLQLFFRPHLNLRSACKVMGPWSHGSPNFSNFETPTWESWTKCHLDVGLVERHRVYYKGEGDGFPQVWAVMSLVTLSCPWLVLTPKMFQLCTNHLVLVLCRSLCIVDTCHSS
jgi:hypothetical protein